jgi:hypothetical protein
MAHGAAKASESAVVITSHRIALQYVLHDVGAFKLVASDIRDGKHAHYYSGQWKKRQKQHVYVYAYAYVYAYVYVYAYTQLLSLIK